MIPTLLRVRRQRLVNLIRYHFDRGTILWVGLTIALVVVWQWPHLHLPTIWRDRTARGAPDRWFFGALGWLPVLAVTFYALARGVKARSAEYFWLHLVGAPKSLTRRWMILRQLMRTLPIILAVAIPTMLPGGAPGGWWHGPVLIVGYTVVALIALMAVHLGPEDETRMERKERERKTRDQVESFRIVPRGPLSALLVRDLAYLQRGAAGSLGMCGAAAIGEFFVAQSALSTPSGTLAILIVHAIAALLTVNGLLALFEHDAAHPGLLRTLPIPGRRFWAARVLIAMLLCAVPIVPAFVLAVLVPLPLVELVAIAGLGFVVIPAVAGILYANIGVALF
ncbi:MAG TPA: hypothetical protein VF720_16240, partial [Candidatus Eisenbacteria bacterium]